MSKQNRPRWTFDQKEPSPMDVMKGEKVDERIDGLGKGRNSKKS